MMLQNTFCHLPGIGPKMERRLWASGYHSWQVLQECGALPFWSGREPLLRKHLDESVAALANDDPLYFHRRLPPDEQWRLFSDFRHSVAYLDIETTGLGGPEDYITTIALYDGHSIQHFVHDDNLLDFREIVQQYRLLVTYNGKTFDLPFIRNYLSLRMDQAHIDLRYVLRSLGLRGGLKACERQLGLNRETLDGVDGYFAVLLWYDYSNRGNPKALETLLAYNIQDVVNLEALMIHAYNLKIAQTPFAESHRLPASIPPDLPFSADRETIQRIRRAY